MSSVFSPGLPVLIGEKAVALRALTVGELDGEWKAWIVSEPIRRVQAALAVLNQTPTDLLPEADRKAVAREQVTKAVDASVSAAWQVDGALGRAFANSYQGVRQMAWFMGRDSAKAEGVTQEAFFAAFDDNPQAFVKAMRHVNGVADSDPQTAAESRGSASTSPLP